MKCHKSWEEIKIKKQGKKSRRNIIICCVIIIIAIAAIAGYMYYTDSKETEEATEATTEQEDMDVGSTILSEAQEEVYDWIEGEVYDEDKQQEVYEDLQEEKASDDYTEDNMLVKYNPYGTNTQSLYIYFNTEEATSVSYTVHVDDEDIDDFTRTAYQDEEYMTEHEFQLLGLIADTENTITITLTSENGDVTEKSFTYEMGSLYGTEETILETTDGSSSQELEDGLYVVLGNDSDELDFMYYYDNQGVLRGEVPIIGYRSHRLLFDDDGSMYYSIAQTKIAKVDRLGQVTKVYRTGNYNLHHDYVFDDNGDILVLVSDKDSETVEDMALKIDVETGEATKILDMADLLGDYKETCEYASDGDLDWMHLNTIQWMGDDRIMVSSRETSTIIIISNIFDTPEIDYMLGEEEFWDGTGYEDLLYTKDGDFTIQGGQHAITYEEDEDLEDGQYYIYMYNNNIGYTESQPDFDWSSIGITNDAGAGGDASYYYKYLVDENEKTFELVDSFEVEYSGYVSSAQELDDNIVMDSGTAGLFAEYDEDHELIKSFTMEPDRYFLYRVFKYDFEGFYFAD